MPAGLTLFYSSPVKILWAFFAADDYDFYHCWLSSSDVNFDLTKGLEMIPNVRFDFRCYSWYCKVIVPKRA